MSNINTTLEDIAKIVGCSPGTVSRAINNRPGVNAITKANIMKVIDEVGYRPNAVAQSLVSQQTHSIALIVPDIKEPILNSIALAADNHLFSRGYNLLLFNTGYNPENERQRLQFAMQRRVDGILIRPSNDTMDFFKDTGIPTVLISHTYNGPVSYIDIENETAGYLGTAHLLECGYRRVGFVGGYDMNLVRLRIDGYRRALQERNIPAKEEYIWFGDYSLKKGYQAMEHFMELPEPPDCVFCCSDRSAAGVMQKMLELGISVPDVFGIVGFNDDEMASWPQFNITTIRQPTDYMGDLAAKILLDLIEQTENWIPQKIQIYPQLIQRATTRKIK